LNEWAKKELNPPEDLVKWVRVQEPKLRNKIYEAGLLKAEQANTTRTVAEQLEDYIADLQINSDNGYPALVESNIKRIVDGCGIKFWFDVDGPKIRKFLDDNFNGHTAQHYITNFKMFAHWLKEQGRIKELPVLKSIKYIVPPQRAFEEEELAALYEAARKGPERYALSGHERYVLYKLAFDSGLRREELRSLTRYSFNFEKCTVLVPGTDTKNDNEAYQKITPETVALVKGLVKDKLPLNAKIFDIPQASAIMIREDCEAAGIETKNWKGTIKFHSLRHSLATHLANKKVPPHVTQKIMRHSDITTTMRYYTHLLRGDEDNAIKKLRGFGKRRSKEQSA
jgi:integrase